MWTADLVAKDVFASDGRRRYVVIFHDGTRKLDPVSYAPPLMSQVLAKIAALTEQDAAEQAGEKEDYPLGPLDLTPIPDVPPTPEELKAQELALAIANAERLKRLADLGVSKAQADLTAAVAVVDAAYSK